MNFVRSGMLALLAGSAVLLDPSLASYAQEKSVRPDVNKPFEDPDLKTFLERFEREGREIFDKRDEIVAACKIRQGAVLADIGAGTGLFTRMFSASVGAEGRVYAVDISKTFVQHIEEVSKQKGLKNVVGVVCTPTSSELPANSIDVAFICDTYHHFEFPEKTMRSIHKALRPDGQVILVEFHRIDGVSSDWVLGHVRADQKTFTNEILSTGFRLVEEKKFLKESYFLRFAKAPAE